ncbi:MAG TPA: SAM-dependent methyltransferase [Kofleriaceae bacterium]|nr:SAM-dependent methyltransferase [Kofleriaceae bacterium]
MKNILLASLLLLAACGGKSAPPPAAPPNPPPQEAKAEPPPAATPAEPPAPPPAPEPPKPPEPPAYTPSADLPQPIRDAVTAEDRDEKDRALDAGRKPAEVLAFFNIAPGQKVGELFSATGYTTEIIARVVGDSGKVYAQNSKDILDRFAREPLTARLAKPVMKNTVMVEQPAEKPFPPEAKNLDAVICILNYHDFVWQKVDRAKLNKAVFAALKPGGVYGIVDHSGKPGTGVTEVQTLHRIDEDAVKKEILAAGFKLDGESDVLRNPEDPRDWNASPTKAGEKRGTSDRFVLRFVKPGRAAKGKAGKK